MMAYAHFSRSAKRIEELKSYYEFYEQDFHVSFLLFTSKTEKINDTLL
jgi:hypothetical protein